jgi:acyl-CoA-binding protein
MATELTAQFDQAIEDSKGLSDRPSNDSLLQLYSFYKQATEGDAGEDAPSNPFDFVAKAKYEAWVALKGRTKEGAMQEYIGLVNKLKN